MQDNKKYVKIFKALCDEKRLTILHLLKTGEKCSCVLGERADIAQSSMSYHMKILCESGLVISRQEGKWTQYRLSDEGRENAVEALLKATEKSLIQEDGSYAGL